MIKLILAPLQGYTDYRFRNVYRKYFEGLDGFIAPYIRVNNKMEVKAAYERDVLPENNKGIGLVPQIMAKDADEFLFLMDYLKEFGHMEVNWNLGCPYPMVAKRGMGSGLLPYPERIDEILKVVFNETNSKISVKTRLGYESSEEIFEVLPVLEKYQLEHITIHPRIAKQMYKGSVDLDGFKRCLEQSRHPVFYNGDVSTVQEYRMLKENFPKVEGCLLGRGILMNPFLPEMIKSDSEEFPENMYETLRNYHDDLFVSYREALSGPKHIIQKMYYFWEYFICVFPESGKGLKKIKKARGIEEYENAVEEIFSIFARH